ncbi:hypothetical protein COLO4_34792 [Corchorus olitorius]|uniref:Uncharacterized protein n=1 Tax=Corchorus olitorius TaxID=93759 RepID=A0A1R3GJF4_9ROSI|nr:hypothetical protein COLO4_34792 [Corchorus olitorius]
MELMKFDIMQPIEVSCPRRNGFHAADVYCWQDGAIVANNPSIFTIREAQLLERKGGWRYVDTGQVLIESACSVDRVEEALSKLLPVLPEIEYFRFNPVYFQLIEADVLPAPFMKLPLTYGIFKELQLPFSCLWA